jgi:hypothetical protein
VLSRERRRAVARAVVDDERLEVSERLRRERCERLGEERLLVAHGQQHRDDRQRARL